MLLIQTALRQEFQAVASVLDGPDRSILKRAGSATQIYGRIADHACCVVQTGVGLQAAEQALLKTLKRIERPQLLISIGLAGALAPEVAIGQRWLIGSVRCDGAEPAELPAALHLLPAEYLQTVPTASLVSLQHPALTAQAKQELRRTTQALLCDMETHAAARTAVAHGVPWLGARLVSDLAGETVPPWVLKLPELIRRRAWGGLALQLATHPQDLPWLLRLGFRLKNLNHELAQFTVELIRNVVRS